MLMLCQGAREGAEGKQSRAVLMPASVSIGVIFLFDNIEYYSYILYIILIWNSYFYMYSDIYYLCLCLYLYNLYQHV